MTVSLLAADSIRWSPFWLAIGMIFVVERLVTVWRAGWRGRALAAPMFPELGYAAFLQACFVTSIGQIFRGRKADWNYVPRPAVPLQTPWLLAWGIVLPATILRERLVRRSGPVGRVQHPGLRLPQHPAAAAPPAPTPCTTTAAARDAHYKLRQAPDTTRRPPPTSLHLGVAWWSPVAGPLPPCRHLGDPFCPPASSPAPPSPRPQVRFRRHPRLDLRPTAATPGCAPTRSPSASPPAIPRPTASSSGPGWRRSPLDDDGLGGMPQPPLPGALGGGRDARFRRVVRRGSAPPARSRRTPYTSSCSGLMPGREYHYRFHVDGWYLSPVGPDAAPRRRRAAGGALTMAFASCSNYPSRLLHRVPPPRRGRSRTWCCTSATTSTSTAPAAYTVPGGNPRARGPGDGDAGELPAAARAVQDRPRPAGCARGGAVAGGVGRPRGRQQLRRPDPGAAGDAPSSASGGPRRTGPTTRTCRCAAPRCRGARPAAVPPGPLGPAGHLPPARHPAVPLRPGLRRRLQGLPGRRRPGPFAARRGAGGLAGSTASAAPTPAGTCSASRCSSGSATTTPDRRTRCQHGRLGRLPRLPRPDRAGLASTRRCATRWC